jgi:hypothetical protein
MIMSYPNKYYLYLSCSDIFACGASFTDNSNQLPKFPRLYNGFSCFIALKPRGRAEEIWNLIIQVLELKS